MTYRNTNEIKNLKDLLGEVIWGEKYIEPLPAIFVAIETKSVTFVVPANNKTKFKISTDSSGELVSTII